MKKKVIVIIGSGRSGTSWIHDVTTSHYNYRGIFEPLHPSQVASVSEFAGLYLSESDSCQKLKDYLEDIFYHKSNDSWITWHHMGICKENKMSMKVLQYVYNLPKLKFWSKHRVVKFIQANMMISWIANTFAIPIVFVIRNPFSVIRSQLNFGWDHRLDGYIEQKKIQKFLKDECSLSYLNSLETTLERLTARWCIENLIAIREMNKLDKRVNNVFPITYEFISNANNLISLLEVLGYSEREIVSIHKMSTFRERFRSSKRKSSKGEDLTEEQKEKIKEVFSNFGIDSYEKLTNSFNRLPT